MVHLCWPASQLRHSCTGLQLTGYTEAAPIKAELSRKQETSAGWHSVIDPRDLWSAGNTRKAFMLCSSSLIDIPALYTQKDPEL